MPNNKKKMVQRRTQNSRQDLTKVVTPQVDPPQIKSVVWVARVKRFTATLTTSSTALQITDLGVTSNVRLTGLRIWLDPGLGSLVTEFIDPVTTLLFQTVTDAGSYAARPKTGIMYSRSIQNHVFSGTSSNVLLRITAPSTGDVIYDVHYLQQLS